MATGLYRPRHDGPRVNPTPFTRRALLAAGSSVALAITAGCLDDSAGEDPSTTDTEDALGEGDGMGEPIGGEEGSADDGDRSADQGDREPGLPADKLAVESAIQHQGPACDCCDVYAEYLDGHLTSDLQVAVDDAMGETKAELGVPREVQSCHTVVLDGHVVEGHVPVEVIDAFLAEDPDVDGIALPGMPAGSPGMGGTKRETWTFYGFRDGEVAGMLLEV